MDAVRSAGARMVAFSAKDAGDTWAQLEAFMTNWRRIERLTDEPGPYIYNCTRTSLRAVDLGYFRTSSGRTRRRAAIRARAL